MVPLLLVVALQSPAPEPAPPVPKPAHMVVMPQNPDLTNPARMWANCAGMFVVVAAKIAKPDEAPLWGARSRQALAQARVVKNTENLSAEQINVVALYGASGFNKERQESAEKQAVFDRALRQCQTLLATLPKPPGG